jgi:hypothetical protein
MATDRSIYKTQQVGALNSVASSVANAVAAISDEATRAYCFTKFGAENSSNNVVETTMFTVNRAGRLKSVKLSSNSAVAANATNGFVVTVAKRTAGGAAVPVATWNTDTNTLAQGAITAFAPASLSVVTSSDANLAAGDVLTFKCTKFGAGLLLDGGASVVADVEEA